MQAAIKRIRPILNSCLVARWFTPETRECSQTHAFLMLATFFRSKDLLWQQEWLLCPKERSCSYCSRTTLRAFLTTRSDWLEAWLRNIQRIVHNLPSISTKDCWGKAIAWWSSWAACVCLLNNSSVDCSSCGTSPMSFIAGVKSTWIWILTTASS